MSLIYHGSEFKDHQLREFCSAGEPVMPQIIPFPRAVDCSVFDEIEDPLHCRSPTKFTQTTNRLEGRRLKSVSSTTNHITDVPEIKIDGRRQFYGKPQLTDCEAQLYEQIKNFGLQLVFTKKGPEYRCNGHKVNRRTARRLVDRHYVITASPGLFPDGPAQVWKARD